MPEISALLAASALAVAGRITPRSDTEFTDDVGDLGDRDVVGVIDYLNALPVTNRPRDLLATVRPDQLVLTTSQREINLDMPREAFYICIAPFIHETHNCFHHGLTTCLGELRNAPVHVTITEEDTGNVLVAEQVTTCDSGFLAYWLPRDLSCAIEITQGEFRGRSSFHTGAAGPTCLTDLRLDAAPTAAAPADLGPTEPGPAHGVAERSAH